MALRELPKTTGDFVVIGCKLPQGLHLHVDGRAAPIKLNGAHSPFARHGVGLTNVPADAWALIEKTYADKAFMTRGFVFAQKTQAKAADAAKELKTERNGFEPIDPKNPNTLPGISVTITPEGTDDNGKN